MAFPDINAELSYPWGVAFDDRAPLLLIACASNVITGGNPPYSVTDFFTTNPNFGGVPTLVSGTITEGSADITGVASIAGLSVGNYMTGPGIPDGATIANAAGTTITMSLPATVSQTPVSIAVFTAPLVPAAVINVYLYVVLNSIFQPRWGELWEVAVGFYLAHLCTLWLMAQGTNPNPTAASVAAAGLAIGIKTSKSAGDVSVGSTPILFEGWGTFGLTLYGQQLATWALAIGSGSALIL